MALVQWDGSLATGIPVVDEQHSYLFNIINSLHEKSRARPTRAALLESLDSMVLYVKYHFRTEEEMLEACGYPALQDHRAEHQAFAEKTEAIKAQAVEHFDPALLTEALVFLLDWLVAHIQKRDLEYVPFLKAVGEK